jgi:hypothetical protein
MSGGGGGKRRDRPCTVDGACGRPGYECLFPIEEYHLPNERTTASRWTCLVLGVEGKKLMCGQDNTGSFAAVAITCVKFFQATMVR